MSNLPSDIYALARPTTPAERSAVLDEVWLDLVHLNEYLDYINEQTENNVDEN